MNITTIGLDLAKLVFHVVCCNDKNTIVKKKMLRRNKLLQYLAQLPHCIVAMEACATSNYWAREIEKLGHEIKVIPPQHVKAFLTGNKNDYNDAYAIIVASRQPHIKRVDIKTIEQQDNQECHKARELSIRHRTALSNHIRGVLLEYGICIPKGMRYLKEKLPELLTEETSISSILKGLLQQLRVQLNIIELSIKQFDEIIKQQVKNNMVCQRLQTIPGVGPMVASALFNEIGNGSHYKKGRDVSASLGLVPKQHSSGGINVLLGISKKGNRYLRCLLILGAKAIVSRAKGKTDPLSLWINRLIETRGHNRTCVAYANKMARIAWAVTVTEQEYQPNFIGS